MHSGIDFPSAFLFVQNSKKALLEVVVLNMMSSGLGRCWVCREQANQQRPCEVLVTMPAMMFAF